MIPRIALVTHETCFTHSTHDTHYTLIYAWYLGFTQNLRAFTQDTHYCTIYAYNLVYARYAWYTLIIIYAWYAEYTQDLRNRKSIYAWFTHGTQEQLNIRIIRRHKIIYAWYSWFTQDLRMIPESRKSRFYLRMIIMIHMIRTEQFADEQTLSD